VTQLNQFAEPLAQDELRRRRSAGLSAYEDALLMRWGYPYVLDRFRFHLSLTGSLAETSQDEVSALTRAANQHFSLLSDCMFDSLAIFAEPTKGADFVLLDRCPLIG
jgi:hypothetical protein